MVRSVATRIDLQLRGSANGVSVRGTAHAELDRTAGTLRAELALVSPPLSWEPVLALLAVVDVALLEATVDRQRGDPAFARHRSFLRDEHGREMGEAVACARLVPKDGGYEGRLQIQDARTSMEPTERATHVRALAPAIVVTRADGWAHVLGANAFETDFGNGYGVTSLAEADSGGGASAQTAVDVALGAIARTSAPGLERVAIEARFSLRT